MRLREPVRDAELAADRLRALEAVARLVEAAEARVQVRAPEERVRLDRGEAALVRPGELLVEEGEHLVDGCPPEEHRAADLVPRLDLAPRVAGSECMLASLLERHELRASIARGELGDAHELPGIREVRVAADRLEDGDRPPRDVAQGVGIGRRAHEGDVGALQLGPELGRLVVMAPGVLDRLGESCVGGLERSGAAKRPAELGEQRRAFGGLDREEPARTLEERCRRRELVAIERASSRASEQATSFQGDRASVGVQPDRAPRG